MSAASPARALGVTVDHGSGTPVGTVRVHSSSADRIELCVFDRRDPHWIVETVPLVRGADEMWEGSSARLVDGARYALRADGPTAPRTSFDPSTLLVDPAARGLVEVAKDRWRSVVVDDPFDWGGIRRPATPLAETVVYEAHAKGLTRLAEDVPADLRGTYAGLAHPATLERLTSLGVTAVELLPVQAFTTELRLERQGLVNYWGYNTLGFFAPHGPYATRLARAIGPAEVLREFKGMVRLLHEAGLEVILDVVYNHTAEEGRFGPRYHLRGLDDAGYYRQTDTGEYIDTTGCGNALDLSQPGPRELVTQSLVYWATQAQVDGFRFDLAATLGRDAAGGFEADGFLAELAAHPDLADVKLIAEPWDVGDGGWRTGSFPAGFSEWNDRYRDRVREFWLTDLAHARRHGAPPTGVASLAGRLTGSASTFSRERGPLASVSYVTSHDGFTLADLVSYERKHNLGNGEGDRDGSDDNRSVNLGREGASRDPRIRADRLRSRRNLLATLLVSAGVPMLLAGDEVSRSQGGNNNAYCHDDAGTWVRWSEDADARSLTRCVRRLIALRREHPALRPSLFPDTDGEARDAPSWSWFDADGGSMTTAAWESSATRTLQWRIRHDGAPSGDGGPDQVLVVVHGSAAATTVTLPSVDGADAAGWRPLFSSADEALDTAEDPADVVLAGATIDLDGPTVVILATD